MDGNWAAALLRKGKGDFSKLEMIIYTKMISPSLQEKKKNLPWALIWFDLIWMKNTPFSICIVHVCNVQYNNGGKNPPISTKYKRYVPGQVHTPKPNLHIIFRREDNV